MGGSAREAEGAGGSRAAGKQLDALFSELMHECKTSAPGARLSARLRTALERLRPGVRRALVSRTRGGCAPLFVACRRGNVELVDYLLHVCDAPIEQRGLYEVAGERTAHRVTPLWAAAVSGRLDTVRALADAGADIDAGSDSGSTPVRSACFMSEERVVRELVSRGADITRANHSGGTCLINAVQCASLCAFLLARGAPVDATDTQHKTALHYAIQEQRIETARLLLEAGADPRLCSRAGDDALRTAALRGAADILAALLERVEYPADRAADAYELLGATQLDEFNDAAACLASWRRATALRHAAGGYCDKRPARPTRPALHHAREWRTMDELSAAAGDMDALRTQALLVADRVLGPHHKDTVFRLMYRGASYADAFRYQRCVELWTWALEIRIEKDTLLYTDTCHTVCALTRLMLDARLGRLERGAEGEGATLPRHCDVTRVLRLVAAALPAARAALAHTPVHRKQAETYDRSLRCVTHLLWLLLETASTPEEHVALRATVRELVAQDVRSAYTKDTLLHLCASRLNVIRSTYFADEIQAPPIFPSVAVVSLLLQCGLPPRTRNEARSTALHVAAIHYNFSTELVQELLRGGAHLDTPNKFGDSAASLVALQRSSTICILQHVSLKCLAATALLASGRPIPEGYLPATLVEFVDLHRC